MRLCLSVLLTACAVGLPSLDLADLREARFDFGLKDKFQPGELIVIPDRFAHLDLYKDQTPFTRLADGRAFAVNGLNSRPSFIIHGTSQVIPRQWFRHPRLEYFLSHFEVMNRPLKQAVSLRLPMTLWGQITPEQEEIQKQERRLMHELLRTVTSPLSRACWQRPLESAVTSKFGSPRSLPDGRSYYHTGVDLRAARGTVLRAAGPGRVAFADEMRVPGKMVVLDHGEGLFTRYMHLDSFAVKMGDTVEKGQVIGRTGATGRVEAPHLHWEVVWKGNFADPLAFLQAWEQICDQGSAEST